MNEKGIFLRWRLQYQVTNLIYFNLLDYINIITIEYLHSVSTMLLIMENEMVVLVESSEVDCEQQQQKQQRYCGKETIQISYGREDVG